MQATKKFLAIFLAMTVLFTVCSLSVFATDPTEHTIQGTDHNNNDKITGMGIFIIYADGRTIEYRTVCKNDLGGAEIEYTLYAQCAVIYTDGSSECYSAYDNRLIPQKRTEVLSDLITLSSDKEIEMFSLEFQIHANGVMYWEGYLDVPYTN